MTRQVSPVPGTSTYTYNEHGELATETDARNIVTTRTTDPLDRVTAVSYPNPTLNTVYTYDTGAFGKGRLTGITRHGETLAYGYDRFGRLLQDGALTYTWDKNGNTYPTNATGGRNPKLQSIAPPTGEPRRFGYDAAGAAANAALRSPLYSTASCKTSAPRPSRRFAPPASAWRA